MKELLKRLEKLEEKTAELEAKVWENPEDEELEKAWDEAYKEEFNTREELVKLIINTLKNNGMEDITREIVNRMLACNREELVKIAEM